MKTDNKEIQFLYSLGIAKKTYLQPLLNQHQQLKKNQKTMKNQLNLRMQQCIHE